MVPAGHAPKKISDVPFSFPVSGALSGSGTGNASYDYKQYYTYSAATNQWTPTGSGAGSANGSDSTSATYSGSTAYGTHLPQFPSSTIGLLQPGNSPPILTGSDQQSGGAYVTSSYHIDATYATGTGWTQTGSAAVSSSGETSDTFSASASNLVSYAPSGYFPSNSIPTIGAGYNASASVTASSTTAYDYTQREQLDEYGSWQAASSLSSDSNWTAASGTTNWSVSDIGGGSFSTTLYGNSASGTMSGGGSGSDSYGYQQYYNYTPEDSWQATSGSGGASGGGSANFSFSLSGAYSTADPAWTADAGTANNAVSLVAEGGGTWAGSVSASGHVTLSYGYSTNASYSPDTGEWTSTGGSASAAASGGTNSSFSASANFAENLTDTPSPSWGLGETGSYSGSVSGSGSDWSSYSYTQTAPAAGNLAWGALSGSGGASDGGGATWSYSGAGSYAQSEDGGTVSGSLSGSGSETYGEGHSASASISGGAWSQSGTGGLSASSTYQYGYSGSGSGTTPSSEDYYSSPVTWTMSAESGSGSGSANAGESVEISGAGWTGTPTYSAGTRQEDSYAYSASGTGLAASGSEDQIVSTTTTGVSAPAVTTTYGGSGQMTDGGTTLSWAPADGGAEVSGPYGYEGAGIPPIWSDPSPRPPGPEPGEFGVYSEISSLVPTTGGENSPWPVYATMDPSDVTYVFVTLTAPSLPSVAVVESLPGVPTAPSVVAQTGPTSSLQGLLTNQPPAAVEATPGMSYVAFAGYPQTSATGVTFAPETRVGLGQRSRAIAGISLRDSDWRPVRTQPRRRPSP